MHRKLRQTPPNPTCFATLQVTEMPTGESQLQQLEEDPTVSVLGLHSIRARMAYQVTK